MTKKEAIQKLIENRALSTNLLKPLGINFESFLKLSQMPKDQAKNTIIRLIDHFENELINSLGFKNKKELYLDFLNNFLTVSGFAKYFDINEKTAERLIINAKKEYEENHV